MFKYWRGDGCHGIGYETLCRFIPILHNFFSGNYLLPSNHKETQPFLPAVQRSADGSSNSLKSTQPHTINQAPEQPPYPSRPEKPAREACAACRRTLQEGCWFLAGGNLRCFSKVRCLSEASSDFWKTLLADSRQPRSQPPTKPRRQAAHASRASLSCASLFPQKKPNQPHHSQFSFLPETHSPSTQASNFPVKTLLKKWITGPKPKAVTSVPIPTTPPVR